MEPRPILTRVEQSHLRGKGNDSFRRAAMVAGGLPRHKLVSDNGGLAENSITNNTIPRDAGSDVVLPLLDPPAWVAPERAVK
ncbi:hypothetical protein RRG08_019790 [Elysia crispata]|uniref:Uncharacterized protein n=1 Tax=Elysia crispata TaxID=231223 RepID=A0AAE1AWE6_9GAST|nr:hypothetical protein RRG08_019790 [Elysia crispata]